MKNEGDMLRALFLLLLFLPACDASKTEASKWSGVWNGSLRLIAQSSTNAPKTLLWEPSAFGRD